MADIVFGLATSHSPMLATEPQLWKLHAERDLNYSKKGELLGPSGEYLSYEELLATAPPGMDREITQEKFDQRYEACQQAITTMIGAYQDAQPDVAVIIGDDQEELFLWDNMPSIAVY